VAIHVVWSNSRGKVEYRFVPRRRSSGNSLESAPDQFLRIHRMRASRWK
jgi:hypothetical protein